MSVYVVSWGLVNKGNAMEMDSIVHKTLEEARTEFDLVDVQTAVKGRLGERAKAEGCPFYVRLEEVEMLDEKDNPTNDINAWTYDASKTLLDEKLSA